MNIEFSYICYFTRNGRSGCRERACQNVLALGPWRPSKFGLEVDNHNILPAGILVFVHTRHAEHPGCHYNAETGLFKCFVNTFFLLHFSTCFAWYDPYFHVISLFLSFYKGHHAQVFNYGCWYNCCRWAIIHLLPASVAAGCSPCNAMILGRVFFHR